MVERFERSERLVSWFLVRVVEFLMFGGLDGWVDRRGGVRFACSALLEG